MKERHVIPVGMVGAPPEMLSGAVMTESLKSNAQVTLAATIAAIL